MEGCDKTADIFCVNILVPIGKIPTIREPVNLTNRTETTALLPFTVLPGCMYNVHFLFSIFMYILKNEFKKVIIVSQIVFDADFKQ